MADGTDQPALYGTMLSVTVEGPGAWKVVRKKDGKTLLTGKWKLSQGGNTLSDDYTEFGPNGSPTTAANYLYQRTAQGPGFAGTWESPMPMESAFVLQIRPYEENGLSFIRSAEDTRNLKFDGKDYPNKGRGACRRLDVVSAPGKRALSRNHRQGQGQSHKDRANRAFTRPKDVNQDREPARPA